MIISEKKIRQIVREELLRESNIVDIFKEKSMNDPSIDTTGKLKYLSARMIGGAVPEGATAIAKGQVDPTPTLKQALTLGWNSKLMDWSLSALGASLDFLPVVGVPLSIGVAKVQAVKAAGAADWFGLVLATIAMYPGVGDAIGFLGRALRDGAGAGARPAAQALLVAIGNITTSEINGMMSKLVPNLTRDAHAAAIASYNKFKSDLQSSLT
jgi:hypothetical protein